MPIIYLYRFCSECKSKVMRAYSILAGDIDGDAEKGYVNYKIVNFFIIVLCVIVPIRRDLGYWNFSAMVKDGHFTVFGPLHSVGGLMFSPWSVSLYYCNICM